MALERAHRDLLSMFRKLRPELLDARNSLLEMAGKLEERSEMARDGAMLTTLVHEEFDKIGTAGKTAFPEKELDIPAKVNNKERWIAERKAAWEFWVACRLRTRANRAFEQSKALCESMGLFAKLTSVAVGSSGTIWSSELVVLNVKVNNPQKKVDPVALVTELRKLGVSQAIIAKAVEAATIELKPAVVYEPTLNL